MKNLHSFLLLLLVAGLSLQSCELFPKFPLGDNDDDEPAEEQSTILELAQQTADLSILADALEITGIDELLDEEGHYTVFAPTNAAFIDLLNSNEEWNALTDIPEDVLAFVLKVHVLSDEFFADDLSTNYFNTLARGPERNAIDIFINTENGVVINGDVEVVDPNIDASNGVVHVVNKVISPSSLLALAASNPNFSILVEALTQPGLGVDFLAALSGEGPLTVVAPTNDAFLALLDSNDEWDSLEDIDPDLLTNVLLYHVGPGNFDFRDLARRPTVNTLLEGNSWTSRLRFVRRRGIRLQIRANSNTALVLQSDVQATNGVIHAIDTVILP